MKKVYYISLLFFLQVLSLVPASGQDATRNYVMNKTMLNSSGSFFVKDIQYYDDLGRPTIQSNNGVGMYGTPVYTSKDYNRLGQVRYEYMPYVSSAGEDDRYYQYHYDGLGRITFTDSPGTDWKDNDKGVSVLYATNAANEVKHYKAPLGSTSLVQDGCYAPGTLHVKKTTDEDGHFLAIYTDMLGRKVLERRNSNSNTYFVYNDKNQLRFVLTPYYQFSGQRELSAYEYRYDERGRLEKKLMPHCEVEQYYYDDDDHLIYQQDALGQLFFYLYDSMGRLAMKGICSNFNYHHYHDVSIQDGQDGLYGTGYVFPDEWAITHGFPEEVIYYDDYGFLSKSKFTSSPYCAALTMSNPVSALGLQTGSIRRTSSNQYLLTAIYYDNKGRVIDKRETLLNGGVKKTLTTYSFTDKPLTENVQLTRNNTTTTVTKSSTYYSANDRPATLAISYNNASPVTVAQYSYNNLGQLTTLQRGGNGGSVTYTYNQRGWTSTVNGTGFKEWLKYTDGVGAACYSGNISSQLWQGGSESFKRGYKFSYDDLSRMTRADYGEGDNLNSHTGRYSELILEYAQNGGIRKLERYGKKYGSTFGKIDNLRMYYHGMQVDSVKEDALPLTYTGAFDFVSKTIPTTGAQYAYYDDGSLKWDANKGISRIDYDRHGHPQRVQFYNGNVTEYVYAADGEKLRTVYRTAVPNITVPLGTIVNLNNSNTLSVDSINYVGDYIYENGQLAKLLFEGGYATISNGQTTYHYYAKDHLGNNRAVINHNTGAIEQVTHYYPFGAVYGDVGTNDALQRYKYNGKELDRMHGLNTYDYGARQYYSILGRWDRMDPLCEKYYSISPYAYCSNNPTNAIDSDGKFITYTNNSNGKTYFYYKGYFYNSSFKIVNGHLVPKNDKITIPTKSYMHRTLQALRKMENSKNEEIKKVFDLVSNMESGIEHNIHAGTEGKGSHTHSEGRGSTTISLNFEEDNKRAKEHGSESFTDYEVVGHELKHAYDFQKGISSSEEDVNGVQYDEYRAVQFENLIRKEEKRPMRTTYGKHIVPKQYLNQ
jgi:RHS repeat-associated protein